ARLSRYPRPEKAFLTGLFSFLDALIDKPLQEALAEIHLSPGISTTLLGVAGEDDPLNIVYQLARCYEIADWEAVRKQSAKLGAAAQQVREAYLEAVRWAGETLESVTR